MECIIIALVMLMFPLGIYLQTRRDQQQKLHPQPVRHYSSAQLDAEEAAEEAASEAYENGVSILDDSLNHYQGRF